MFDLGGQWLGPTQTHALSMAAELGLDTHPQHEEGVSLCRLSDGHVRRYTGTIPSVPVHALLELHFTMMYINRMARTVDIDDPSRTPNADALDAVTAHSALVDRMWFWQAKCAVS